MPDKSTYHSDLPPIGKKVNIRKSFWVILGYLFWFGFFVGSVILHSLTK